MVVENENLAPKSQSSGYHTKTSRQGQSKEWNRHDGPGIGVKNLNNNPSDEKDDSAPRSIRRDINVEELRELRESINKMNVVTNFTAKYLIELECAGKKYMPSFGEDKFSLYNNEQSNKTSPANVNANGTRQKQSKSQNINDNSPRNSIEEFQRAVRRISNESQTLGEVDSKASRRLKLRSHFVKAISARRMSVYDTSTKNPSSHSQSKRRSTAPHAIAEHFSNNNNNIPTQDIKSKPPRPRRGFFKRDTDSESVGEASMRSFFSTSLMSLKEEVESDDESMISSISLTLKPAKKKSTRSINQKESLPESTPKGMKFHESYVGLIAKESKINEYFYDN
jgi:hypothetical protein